MANTKLFLDDGNRVPLHSETHLSVQEVTSAEQFIVKSDARQSVHVFQANLSLMHRAPAGEYVNALSARVDRFLHIFDVGCVWVVPEEDGNARRIRLHLSQRFRQFVMQRLLQLFRRATLGQNSRRNDNGLRL